MSSTMDDRDDAGRIERDNEAIRADMNATLDALGRKLSPGQLIDRSSSYLRDHGGELAANLGRQIKENPVPFALTAIGLVWLIAASGRTRRSEYASLEDYATGGSPSDEYATAYTAGDIAAEDASESKLSHAKERVQEAASHLRERMQYTATAARDRLRSSRERLRSSRQTVGANGGSTSGRMSTVARSTREQALRAKDGFTTMAEEQPLALGAIGLAIGAIIGAVLPGTRREDEMFGRTRDRALERAREVGSEKYQQLRERAVAAAERAQQAAKESLTGADGPDRPEGPERPIAGSPREEGSFRGTSTPVGRA